MPNKNIPRISQREIPGFEIPKPPFISSNQGSQNFTASNGVGVNEQFETVGRDVNGSPIQQKNMFSLSKGKEKKETVSPVDTIIPDSELEEGEYYSREEEGWFSGEPDLPDPDSLRAYLIREAQNEYILPPNTRDLINEQRDLFEKFSRVERLQNYEYLLGPCYIINPNNNEYVIPSLVRKEGDIKWKYRIFRTSSSDLQFKCHNALRADGSLKKGEETNPRHHYGQSDKVFTDLHLILEDIYKNNSIYDKNGRLTYRFLPKDSINGEEGRYETEDEMRETYFEPKNKLLAIEMERRIKEEAYLFIIDSLTSFEISWLGEDRISVPSLEKYLNNSNFINFCEEFLGIGSIKGFEKLSELWKEMHEFDRKGPRKELIKLESQAREIRRLLKIKLIDANTKRQQNYTLPFEPNFDTDKPIRTYSKFGIEIEDYLVETPEGDQLVFAMAHDQKGRVYVDNIFAFPPRISSYGTYENIANFGKIVYKPTDHEDQVDLIDEKYVHEIEGTSNKDISEFHALIPLVNRYCHRLHNQGKFVFALRDLQ